jgi:hypothetical protein
MMISTNGIKNDRGKKEKDINAQPALHNTIEKFSGEYIQ